MSIFHRKKENDLAQEIRQHLDERVESLVESGMPLKEAYLQARREFGNVALLEEQGREVWRWNLIEQLFADLRYAMRQLRRAPSFTFAAILTLALGIGATTAVFSVVYFTMLHPLPYKDSERLVSVQSIDIRGTPVPTTLSYPTFFDFRKDNSVFDHLVSFHSDDFTLIGSRSAIHLSGQVISWGLFDLLQVRPMLGRGFLPSDEKRGERPVILSYQLWQREFGADVSIIGRAVTLDGFAYTVVGIAPAGFNFPAGAKQVELWTTLSRDAMSDTGQPVTEQRGARILDAIARLKPGVSLAAAQAQMNTVAANLARQYPDSNRNVPKTEIQSALDLMIGNIKRPLTILLGAVSLVLLIACANIANLLLARTADRGREFAVRMAIGAARGRVVRQLITENLLLASLGCASGVLIAWGAVHFGLPLIADGLPRFHEVHVDGIVLAFAIGLALLTTVLFSIPAALQISRAEFTGSMKQSIRNATHSDDRLRNTLVVAQVALGLILLSGAGLLTASFVHLMRRSLGFQPDQLMSFNISLPGASYSTEEKGIRFVTQLIESISTLPGVVSTGAGTPLPLTGGRMGISFNLPDRPSPPFQRPRSNIAIVTPGYFRTIGTPLLQGREFTERDNGDGPSVLIVNQAFAQKFFPGENAVGKKMEPGANSNNPKIKPVREIVGVVGNARQTALGREEEPIYYFPFKQLAWMPPSIVVRTSVPPLTLESALRQTVASMDKEVPVHDLRTLNSILEKGTNPPRFLMILLGSFAGISLLLTATGLYGVLAYSVLRRTREIGVRMALGATQKSVLAMVGRQALILVSIGIPIGVAGAFAGERLLKSILFDTGSRSLILMSAACGVVIVTGMVAAYLPARRAASVDPIQALRSE